MATRRPSDVQDGPDFFDEEPDSEPAMSREPGFEGPESAPRANSATAGPQAAGSTRQLIVEADGGSRGNPGPAAYGALVRDALTGEVIAAEGQTLGRATNNVAEYSGLIAGLEMAQRIDPGAAVEVRMDSKLVIEQMAGRWKIKHVDMKPLAMRAARVRPARVTWTWIPREQNRAADALVNAALDGAPVRRPEAH